jgi:ABC-type Na+ efflux pump permease subunit
MAARNLKNLLHRVALRQHVVSLGRWVYRFWLALAVAYLLALLAARLLAVIPDVFTWETLLFIPAAAIIFAMAAARRPSAAVCSTVRRVNMRRWSPTPPSAASMRFVPPPSCRSIHGRAPGM